MRFSKAKTSIMIILASIFCITTLLTAFLFFPKDSVNAFTSVSSSNAVTVPQLWNSSTRSFNETNFNKLLSYISSNGTISGVNTSRRTAADIRGYTYGGKSSGRAVVVQLGNYQWQVVYLTRTNNTSGDRIATLLMVNNDGTATYGDSSSNYGPNDFVNGYPTSMYGTSHIRAVTLNNGGPYVNITTDTANPTSVTQATKRSSHKYALFTVDSRGLTDYLVQPKNVWYQTQAQLTGSANPAGCTLNNESLSTNINTGWNQNSTSYTYQTKTYYTQWGNDYLWLPSLSETGTRNSKLGFWELSTTERSASINWWSRSGYSSYSAIAYSLDFSGSSSFNAYVYTSYGVRAALHLNLDKAANSLIEYTITAQSNNTNYGTVSGGGTYHNGDSITLRATPNTGYRFVRWERDGSQVSTSANYTFTVSESYTYTAIFEPIPCTIRTTINISGAGSVTGGGTYDYGATATISATANTGYQFIGWDTNGDKTADITANPHTFTVTGNATYTAIFEIIPKNILIRTNDASLGRIIVNGQLVDSIQLQQKEGDEITELIACINAGYAFLYWLDDATGSIFTDNPLTFTVGSTDTTLTAVFSSGLMDGVAVTAQSGGEARISGYSEDMTTIHLTAVAYSGYEFAGWYTYGDNQLISTSASCDIPIADVDNKLIIAHFTPRDTSNLEDSTDNTGDTFG